ncbi:ACP phosphodiesterase [Arthrobacter sp. MYb227]|uniref:NADPH-dependent FMN reductase n=1 Tax=Arthrobacter sp. MYb227 TaxID=1848601 RepID=UPI000CFB0C85|nr:NADPH-dependent FMN reductase [Arthrobacter sp. MYb227]PQZ94774.1 ACP phosphodiesterase [Arthrobacter sp. MYb227]
MATYNIGYIVGSLSSTSINRILSRALIKLAPENLTFTEIPIRDLPLYSQDHDENYPPEGIVLKHAIQSADGILIISPEFNRSIPGGLKNAIDWASRPKGTNSFARKPTGVIGASTGAIGTAVMQSHMRSVLSFLDAPQLSSPEVYLTFKPGVFEPDGTITDDSLRGFLEHYMLEYCAFVQRVLDANAEGHIGDPESPRR